MKPLGGLRVVEYGNGLTFTFCGRVLADLGADVIRVEQAGSRPIADPELAIPGTETSALTAIMNLGKRLVDLAAGDLAKSLGEVVADAHLFIIGSNDQAPDGEVVKELRRIFPSLATLVISPYGAVGPSIARPTSDLTLQHDAGFAWHQAMPVQDPEAQPPIACADREGPLAAGLNAAIAALCALLAVESETEAPQLDFSIEDFYAQLLIDQAANWNRGERQFARKRKPGETPTIAGGIVWALSCADGWVMISPREQHQWDKWMQAIGSPPWSSDEALCGSRAIRQKNAEKLQALMQEWTTTRPRAEVARLAQEARVACFPISTPADLVCNDQIKHRAFFDTVPMGGHAAVPVPGLPFHMVDTAGDALPKGRARNIPRAAADTGFGASSTVGSRASRKLGRSLLEGVRVLDFSWVMAGPMATKILGLLGAEVIKVESSSRPEFTQRGGFFSVINNNKKSCSINITDPRGQDLVRKLAEKCDIVVENFSAGVLEKYGLGAQQLRISKPDMIYVSASGMGRTGPQRDMLAYGTLLQGYSGRVGMIGTPNPRLEAMGVLPAWTDPVTAWWEVVAILAALRHRRTTGRGSFVDLSMFESTIALLPEALLRHSLGAKTGETGGNRQPGAAPAGCFRTRGDDAWMALSASTDAQWKGLCATLDRPGWLNDPQLAHAMGRLERKAELDRAVGDWACTMDAAEAVAKARRNGVPAACSRNFAELANDAHLRQRGVFGVLPDGSLSPTLPWRDAKGWRGRLAAAPALGQHDSWIFGELLGLSPTERDQLAQDKVIG